METSLDYEAWYRRNFAQLRHAGLWLRGGELNTLPAQECERRELRVLFTRLSSYEDTGYSFTHQILYQVAADVPGVFPDLAYLPPRADRALFERDGVPWLIGTQSKRGPAGFDLVGFSNSIVQELVNLRHFLEKSAVPLAKSARLERDDLPLLLLGGANSLYTSVLWTQDPLVDGIFVGEDDGAIRHILELCRDAKREGVRKRELLERLESVPGFFQPERPRATKKAFVWDLNAGAALERGPVYHLTDSLGSAHLQISEGCPCFCSFCAESWDRKPYRERRSGVLHQVARRAKAAMGLDSIELYSFNFNMHSGLYQILWDLAPEFRAIGLKSQRFDLLAHDPEMVRFQHAIEKASITCGLEGISPRLRRYLHKNLEDDDLHQSLVAIFSSRARALKVFLIATGLEEEQDFLALSDLLDHMKGLRERHGASTRMLFSITPLVRFPWTPLEYEDAHPIEHYEPILARVGELVRAAGFEFRESADLPEYWVSQVLVRAADERVGAALDAAVRASGFVYDRELGPDFQRAFERALWSAGLDPSELLRGHDFAAGQAKPWARIDTGVHREFLWAEVQRARSYVEIDYCLGRSWTRAKCFHCGGCPSKQHIRDIVLAKQERGYELEEFEARIASARAEEVGLRFHLRIGPAGNGLSRKEVGVALARALMLGDDGLVPLYRGYESSHWAGTDVLPVWIEGDELLVLRWRAGARARIEALLADPERRASLARELGAWCSLQGLAQEGWSPGALRFESPFPFEPRSWLERQRLGLTLRRTGDQAYAYEVGAKAKKRDVLRSLSFERRGEGALVHLEPGRRFDPREFAQQAFALPRRSDWVRVRVIAGEEHPASALALSR